MPDLVSTAGPHASPTTLAVATARNRRNSTYTDPDDWVDEPASIWRHVRDSEWEDITYNLRDYQYPNVEVQNLQREMAAAFIDIVDFDGTLFVTMAAHESAWREGHSVWRLDPESTTWELSFANNAVKVSRIFDEVNAYGVIDFLHPYRMVVFQDELYVATTDQLTLWRFVGRGGQFAPGGPDNDFPIDPSEDWPGNLRGYLDFPEEVQYIETDRWEFVTSEFLDLHRDAPENSELEDEGALRTSGAGPIGVSDLGGVERMFLTDFNDDVFLTWHPDEGLRMAAYTSGSCVFAFETRNDRFYASAFNDTYYEIDNDWYYDDPIRDPVGITHPLFDSFDDFGATLLPQHGNVIATTTLSVTEHFEGTVIPAGKQLEGSGHCMFQLNGELYVGTTLNVGLSVAGGEGYLYLLRYDDTTRRFTIPVAALRGHVLRREDESLAGIVGFTSVSVDRNVAYLGIGTPSYNWGDTLCGAVARFDGTNFELISTLDQFQGGVVAMTGTGGRSSAAATTSGLGQRVTRVEVA